jgi:hypothetical protein
MELFKGQNLLEFSDRFKTDEDCKKYLAGIKWQDGFKCLKCAHKKSQIRKDFSRTCNICSHHESATANTLFHKVKFGVRKAFFITFEMGTSTKSLSASYMGVRYGVTEKTARLWMHKVREATGSSGNNPMDGNVHLDEFVWADEKKKK